MPRNTLTSTLTKKSQITLPKKVRTILGLQPGDQVKFEIRENGRVELRPIPSKIEENFGKVRARKKPEDFKKIRKTVEKAIAQEVTGEY